jgi:hypothetical protein
VAAPLAAPAEREELTIPTSWDDVTADWMTAALAMSHPGVEVERVELVLIDDGTNRRARFALTCREGSGTGSVGRADPKRATLGSASNGSCAAPVHGGQRGPLAG